MSYLIETILIIVIMLLVWIVNVFLTARHIRYKAKKKWNKNVKTYPYFKSNFFKKLFLIGLKGALSPYVIVFTFISNISILFLCVLGIWYCVEPTLILSNLFNICLGVFAISTFLKLAFYYFDSISF